MHSWVDGSTIGRIDRATLRHGGMSGDLGELEQLAALFQPPYLRDLYQALAPRSRSEAQRRSLNIKLGWIDKMPLAAIGGARPRVELGDLAIFSIDQLVAPDGKPLGSPQARAVLAQAKVVRNLGRMRAPVVPGVREVGPTKRELALLAGWPQFDLYEWSGSHAPLVTGINLRGATTGLLPYGWYIAAPCDPHKRLGNPPFPWTSWWMAAPPVRSHPLDITFGRFLTEFLREKPITTNAGPLSVGAQFACPSYPPPRIGSGWDRLCAELLALVEANPAPQHIFGQSKTRLTSLTPILSSFLSGGGEMHFHARYAWPEKPFWRPPIFDWNGYEWSRRRDDIEPQTGDGMPVLIIHTTLVE